MDDYSGENHDPGVGEVSSADLQSTLQDMGITHPSQLAAWTQGHSADDAQYAAFSSGVSSQGVVYDAQVTDIVQQAYLQSALTQQDPGNDKFNPYSVDPSMEKVCVATDDANTFGRPVDADRRNYDLIRTKGLEIVHTVVLDKQASKSLPQQVSHQHQEQIYRQAPKAMAGPMQGFDSLNQNAGNKGGMTDYGRAIMNQYSASAPECSRNHSNMLLSQSCPPPQAMSQGNSVVKQISPLRSIPAPRNLQVPLAVDMSEKVDLSDQDWGDQTRLFLFNLMTEHKLTDAAISTGKYTIKVHKLVLAMSSELFASFLSEGTDGKSAMVIVPSHISDIALKVFVTFLYLGTVKPTLAVIKEIQVLANIFEIHSLEHLCYGIVIKHNLSTNVGNWPKLDVSFESVEIPVKVDQSVETEECYFRALSEMAESSLNKMKKSKPKKAVKEKPAPPAVKPLGHKYGTRGALAPAKLAVQEPPEEKSPGKDDHKTEVPTIKQGPKGRYKARSAAKKDSRVKGKLAKDAEEPQLNSSLDSKRKSDLEVMDNAENVLSFADDMTTQKTDTAPSKMEKPQTCSAPTLRGRKQKILQSVELSLNEDKPSMGCSVKANGVSPASAISWSSGNPGAAYSAACTSVMDPGVHASSFNTQPSTSGQAGYSSNLTDPLASIAGLTVSSDLAASSASVCVMGNATGSGPGLGGTMANGTSMMSDINSGMALHVPTSLDSTKPGTQPSAANINGVQSACSVSAAKSTSKSMTADSFTSIKKAKKGRTRRVPLPTHVAVRPPPKKRAKMELNRLTNVYDDYELPMIFLSPSPSPTKELDKPRGLRSAKTKNKKKKRGSRSDITSQLAGELERLAEYLEEGERQYKCELCGNEFVFPKRSVTHILNTHDVTVDQVISHITVRKKESTPKVCNICGYKTKDPNFYYIHYHKYFRHGVPLPQGWKPFACDICGKECYTKFQLKEHKLVHVEKTPFMCEICGQGFRSRTCLNSHVFHRHSDERKHSCSECQKTFKTKTQKRVHMRTHTGEKPFSCPNCSYKSTTRGNMRLHLSNKHKFDAEKVKILMMQLKGFDQVQTPPKVFQETVNVDQSFPTNITVFSDNNVNVSDVSVNADAPLTFAATAVLDRAVNAIAAEQAMHTILLPLAAPDATVSQGMTTYSVESTIPLTTITETHVPEVVSSSSPAIAPQRHVISTSTAHFYMQHSPISPPPPSESPQTSYQTATSLQQSVSPINLQAAQVVSMSLNPVTQGSSPEAGQAYDTSTVVNNGQYDTSMIQAYYQQQFYPPGY